MHPKILQTATESAFQRTVVGLFEGYGFRVSHNPDSRKSTMAGIPDLSCFHRASKAIVILELKTMKGILTEEQQFTLDCYNKAGIFATVARPVDLENGFLEIAARHYAFHKGDENECIICTDN